jgi:hypothetical protein
LFGSFFPAATFIAPPVLIAVIINLGNVRVAVIPESDLADLEYGKICIAERELRERKNALNLKRKVKL